jgi:3-dehydroquinate synthase
MMAIDLSIREGLIDESLRARASNLFERAGLPVCPPGGISVEQYLEVMAIDKKTLDGNIRLVLLRALGEAFVSDDYDPENLRKTLAAWS